MKAHLRQLLLTLLVFCLMAGGTLFAENTQGRAIICVQANTSLLNANAFETSEVLYTTGTESTDGMLRSDADAKELCLITSDTLTSEALAEQAALLPGVLFAEPDIQVSASTEDTASQTDTQADTQAAPLLSQDGTTANFTSLQWGNTNTGQFAGTIGTDIAYSAWNTGATKGDVVAAVVDSGIDYNHPDLKNVMWHNDGQYNIGGGTYGYNTLPANSQGEAYDSTNPMDDNEHGTHCAGIMASEWNDFGTSGAVSGVKLMAVKVLDDAGYGYNSNIIKGFSYVKAAILAGVNVKSANFSVGGSSFSKAQNLIFQEIGELGCVVAKASGNDSKNLDTQAFDSAANSVIPSVVVVNALKANDTIASFSNYGRTTSDVFAPGDTIVSTIPQSLSVYQALLTKESNAAYESFEAGAAPVIRFDADTATNFFTDGSRSLASQTNASGSLVLTSIPTQVRTDAKGFSFISKIDADILQRTNYTVSVKKKGEDSFIQVIAAYRSQTMTNVLSGGLPADTDFDNFTLKIEITGASPNTPFYMDSLGLCTQKTAYEFFSGTSMAAPYVAAEAAYLSAKYPNEDAATIAARIKGGVIRSENLKSLSRSDGRVSYEAAENPYPVINAASLSNDSITLTGSFFGASGAVTIGGAEARIISRTASKIVCAIPEGFTAGLQEIVVNNEKGYGRASLELGKAANLFEITGAVTGLDDVSTILDSGYNGDQPVIGAFTAQDTFALYAYDTRQNEWRCMKDFGSELDLFKLDPLSITFVNGHAYMPLLDMQNRTVALYEWNSQTDKLTALATELTVQTRLISVSNRLIAADQAHIYEINTTTGVKTELGSLPKEIQYYHLTYGPESNSIVLCGGVNADKTANSSLLKITVGKASTTAETLSESFDLPENIANNQTYDYVLLGIKDGLMLTGLFDTDGNDTFMWNYAAGKWASFGKNFSTQKAYNTFGWAIDGLYYTYGEQPGLAGDTGSQQIFRATAVNTVPLYVNTSTEAHVQNIGWQPRAASTHTAGTTGQALRMEALKIDGSGVSGVNLIYDAHVQNIGWQSTNDTANWKQEGQLAGTTGKALRLEAVRIALTGDKAAQYDVFYRAHVQNVGWQSWVKNGETAGSTGKALRMEALEVVVLPKGETPEN